MKNLILFAVFIFSAATVLPAQTYADLSVDTELKPPFNAPESSTDREQQEIALLQLILQDLSYPELAEEYQIEGTVVLELFFYEGGINKVGVRKSLGFGCDEAAAKVLNKYASEFRAVYYRAKGPKSVKVPIRFSMR